MKFTAKKKGNEMRRIVEKNLKKKRIDSERERARERREFVE